MAGNLNSGMCSPLCSDVCAFYLPQGLTMLCTVDDEICKAFAI